MLYGGVEAPVTHGVYGESPLRLPNNVYSTHWQNEGNTLTEGTGHDGARHPHAFLPCRHSLHVSSFASILTITQGSAQ